MSIRKRNILFIVISAVLILLIPFVAMQVSDRVNWSLGDFIIVFILLVGVGLVYELAVRRLRNKMIRYIVTTMTILVFLLIWVELAVGIFH